MAAAVGRSVITPSPICRDHMEARETHEQRFSLPARQKDRSSAHHDDVAFLARIRRPVQQRSDGENREFKSDAAAHQDIAASRDLSTEIQTVCVSIAGSASSAEARVSLQWLLEGKVALQKRPDHDQPKYDRFRSRRS